MARFIHSNVIYDEAPSADGTYSWPLPSGALSHLLLTIKALNVTDEASVADLLALVTRIEVLHRGSAVFSASAADAAVLSALVTGAYPVSENNIATDNATRAVPLVIPFARRTLDPGEGLPARPSGTYQLQLTVDIATAEADGLILQASAVEMPEATPSTWLRQTTMNFTPTATGDDTVPLARVSQLAGVLFWSTTVPTSTAWTATIQQASLLINNQEYGYSSIYWEQLHAILMHRLAASLEVPTDSTLLKLYGLMDFDPARDGAYLVDLVAASEAKLRITAGDTSPTRLIPLEISPIELLTL